VSAHPPPPPLLLQQHCQRDLGKCQSLSRMPQQQYEAERKHSAHCLAQGMGGGGFNLWGSFGLFCFRFFSFLFSLDFWQSPISAGSPPVEIQSEQSVEHVERMCDSYCRYSTASGGNRLCFPPWYKSIVRWIADLVCPIEFHRRPHTTH